MTSNPVPIFAVNYTNKSKDTKLTNIKNVIEINIIDDPEYPNEYRLLYNSLAVTIYIIFAITGLILSVGLFFNWQNSGTKIISVVFFILAIIMFIDVYKKYEYTKDDIPAFIFDSDGLYVNKTKEKYLWQDMQGEYIYLPHNNNMHLVFDYKGESKEIEIDGNSGKDCAYLLPKLFAVYRARSGFKYQIPDIPLLMNRGSGYFPNNTPEISRKLGE